MRRTLALSTWVAYVCISIVFSMLCTYSADAMEDNNNDTGNNLGLLSKTCSTNFCRRGVSGLDLWMTFEQVCAPSIHSQPYLQALGELNSTDSSDGGGVWSPRAAGFLCIMVGIVCSFAGYKAGGKVGARHKCLYPLVVG